MAQTPAVSTRLDSWCYGLRDEQIFHWRVGGALCRPILQYSFSVLATSSMELAARCSAIPAMDDPGSCCPSRHSDHPPSDGNIFRHQSRHSPFSSSILRDRVLDWFFDQHGCYRIMASITNREVSNRENGRGPVSTIAFGFL